MGEEGVDFCLRQLASMTLAVEEDEATHPTPWLEDSPSQPIHPAGFASTCWSKFSFSPAKASNHGNLATLGRDLQRSYQA